MFKTRTPLTSIARRFVRSESGVAAPLLGILMLLLIGFIGFAIDIGRSTLVKARLADALDAAGLAVGARLSTSDYSADAKKFVQANFAAGYAGATVKTVTATANSTKSVITLNATAEMPTSFMKLFGKKTVTVGVTSEITRASSGLELVMVLDNTYSMELSKSMPGLKSAANTLIDIVFGGAETADKLYVGLVPFSQAVNIGKSRVAWTDPARMKQLATYYPSLWTGCVEERLNGLDQTDDVPILGQASLLFKPYFSPDSSSNDWIRWWGSIDVDYSNGQNPRGPGASCPQEITPMTNVKSKVSAGIANMKPSGGTHINVGAAWGWRMLSPKWRGYWDGDMQTYSLPLDYGTKRMNKAMVLMTDGSNTMYDDPFYGAFGKLSDGRLGTTTSVDTAIGTLDTRLKKICSNAKSAGIIVYAVAYANPPAAAKGVLESCATTLSYYFDAKDQAALSTAFKTIGDSLSNLRVSK